MSPSDLTRAERAVAAQEIKLLTRRLARLDRFEADHPDATPTVRRLIREQRAELHQERQVTLDALRIEAETPEAVRRRFAPEALPWEATS